jgi:hypothetical protein
MAVPPQSLAQGTVEATEARGTVRPHLLMISGARKFVVAVAGRRRVTLDVSYAPTATNFLLRSEMTRWAKTGSNPVRSPHQSGDKS